MIDSVFTKIVERKVDDMQTHFVYAGRYYFNVKSLRSFLLQRMKINKIKKAMITKIYMEQEYLITKEIMDKYCKREFTFTEMKVSVGDDLEALFEIIHRGKKLYLGRKFDDEVLTYFFPKLTRVELKLVAHKDPRYMAKFYGGLSDEGERIPDEIDVDEADMEASESDSKFVYGRCRRATFKIKHPSKLKTCCTLQ